MIVVSPGRTLMDAAPYCPLAYRCTQGSSTTQHNTQSEHMGVIHANPQVVPLDKEHMQREHITSKLPECGKLEALGAPQQVKD